MDSSMYFSPNIIYHGGTVITMDKKTPQAEAVATHGGRIVAVGSATKVLTLAGPSTKVVNLNGRTMLPGLIEPHNHFIQYGPMALMRVDLNSPPIGQIRNIKELQEALEEKVQTTSKGEWILGYGYDDTLFEEKRHPTRSDLDQVSLDHPIFISHISAHMLAANSRALLLAGITKDTPQPSGGVIRKDPKTGEPDGVLEEMAMLAVYDILPKLTVEQRMALMEQGAQQYLKTGVTSLSDAGVAFPGPMGVQDLLLYQKAVGNGSLAIRVNMMIYAQSLLKESPGFLTEFGDERLKIGPAKIIGDGSLQGYTGWLTRPYHTPFKGDKSYRGYPVTAPDQLNPLVSELHQAGYQIAIHANGDAAIDAAIGAYRQAQKSCPRENTRHRIEHCQTVREDQLEAMAELGISPSFFVSHTFYWGDRHREIFLGPERAERISPLKSAQKRGIRFSIHSDCPVTPVSPLFCVFAAVNRVTGNGRVLGSEFRLTPEEALRAVTIDAAWQTFEESIKGTIEEGKLADFTILAENPLEGDPMRIKDIRVEEVIIGDKTVFQVR
jgi:predicted amidohydrolase YtcJ